MYICSSIFHCLWGIFYGAHCTNARAQSHLPRCPVFGGEFILNRTAFLIASVFSVLRLVSDFDEIRLYCNLVYVMYPQWSSF